MTPWLSVARLNKYRYVIKITGRSIARFIFQVTQKFKYYIPTAKYKNYTKKLLIFKDISHHTFSTKVFFLTKFKFIPLSFMQIRHIGCKKNEKKCFKTCVLAQYGRRRIGNLLSKNISFYWESNLVTRISTYA